MTRQLIQAAPVRKRIRVKTCQARAFEVFVTRFDSWWPRTHHIGNAEMKEAVIEPQPGGRWYEKGKDGSQCEWGRVLVWEPPSRLVLSWTINSAFQPDKTVQSEVEVRFTPESGHETLVELEHRICAADSEAIHAAVDSPRGWGALLDMYSAAAARTV
ncbi:MAG TPA: SRPBCC family protein [Rhizomicrobium sp.]|jgi:uncharacterized protein YndB with AHSA1/START domain